MNAYFLVDTLTNLQKGGRLSNAQAMIGGLLKIKPILEFHDGKIVAIEKIRTQKKALQKIEALLQSEFEQHDQKSLTVCIIHANAKEFGKIKKNLKRSFRTLLLSCEELVRLSALMSAKVPLVSVIRTIR